MDKATFRALDASGSVLTTRIPTWGSVLSLEYQRMPPCLLSPHFKQKHLVSVMLGPETVVERRHGDARRVERFAPGDVGIYPIGRHAHVKWYTPVEAVHIHVRPRLLQSLAAEYHGTANVMLRGRLKVRDPLVHALGVALFDASLSPNHETQANFKNLSTDLCRHLARVYCEPASWEATRPVGALDDTALQRVFEHIESRHGDDLTVEEMARVADFSPFYFSRLFRSTTGFSPHQYLMRFRVERAKHLLEHDGASPSDVARQTGFYDQSHMTSLFKRFAGVTPGAFLGKLA